MRLVAATVRGRPGGTVERRREPEDLVLGVALPLAHVAAGAGAGAGAAGTGHGHEVAVEQLEDGEAVGVALPT